MWVLQAHTKAQQQPRRSLMYAQHQVATSSISINVASSPQLHQVTCRWGAQYAACARLFVWGRALADQSHPLNVLPAAEMGGCKQS